MSQTTLNPYLHFNGNAEEALNFYKSVLGGETEITRFSDFPGMPVAEELKNDVMHAVLKSNAMQLMLSDATPLGDVVVGTNFSVTLSGDDAAALTDYFNGLSEGGEVTTPLSTHPWGATFGMLIDKFGVHWMVNIDTPKS